MTTEIEFEFTNKAMDVNMDGDILYDLTYGGYIKPHDILTDKELANKVVEAGKLLIQFFDAISDYQEDTFSREE